MARGSSVKLCELVECMLRAMQVVQGIERIIKGMRRNPE